MAPTMPKRIERMIIAGIAANVHLMMIATMRQNGISTSAIATRCGAAGGWTDMNASPVVPAAMVGQSAANRNGRNVMRIVDLASEPREKWRDGVLTRMRVSAANGGTQLCLFEQWCE